MPIPRRSPATIRTTTWTRSSSTKFAESGSPAYTLVKNFQWTNDDQNSVARSIALDGLTDDEAAKKFIDANPALVAKWLQGTGAEVQP